MPSGRLLALEDGLEVALDEVGDGDRLAVREAFLRGDGEDLRSVGADVRGYCQQLLGWRSQQRGVRGGGQRLQ